MRRRPPSRWLLALALLALGAAAPLAAAGADTEAEPLRIAVPVALPIQLDGTIVDAEWEGAAVLPLAPDGSTLRLAQRDGMLFLGIQSPVTWAEGASVWFCFTPDTADAGLYAPGAVRLDFEPREHNRPHLVVVGNTGAGDVPSVGQAVARAHVTGAATSIEIALRLALIGVTAEQVAPVRFAVIWMRGAGRSAASWPRGIRTSAPVGQRPPDLASSARWARLEGWQDPGGPGAISRTAWEALVAADEELARRGHAAHQVGMAIQQDASRPKSDAAVQAGALDHFAWIAAREALTPYDVSVLARIYRHLNRKSEALALLDALATAPAWRGSPRLLYDRALALESAERYAEAAADWRSLAQRSGSSLRQRYESLAGRADERAAQWAVEQALRQSDAARADLPLVLLRTTRGSVVIQLLPDDVPEGVAHFLDLLGRRAGTGGFYDGTRFHRVEGDFLVQGGDPISREDVARAGSGTGPTSVTAELNDRYGYFRGAVAFARGIGRVNGSQFFILTSPRPALAEEGYTVFGHVIAGMDVVDRIELGDELVEVRLLAKALSPKSDEASGTTKEEEETSK